MNQPQSSRLIVERISKYLDTAFPIFFFLLAVSFYLRTYDSAQVKITELQMFGTILIALWCCKVFESGHWPFTKHQTLTILPFILIFSYGVFSFIRSPLHWGSFDFFVRRVMYIGFAMIAVTEMTSLLDFRRITKWLVIALAVCTIYGLIQKIDFNFFPPGPPVVGIDKFVWRGAFGPRVFSTFGNPNFYSNFLVIMVPVMMALYLRSRQFYLLPLILLTLANIYWTGSKGPAMGLIAGTSVFSFLALRFFVNTQQAKTAVISGAVVFILILGGYIVKKVFYAGPGTGITSFSFRMYTWLSTWEMVNARPILGNGIGTFWVIYPAYRRPAIFHIESKHNTETDHAENEHLEVWMDEGLIGEGFWIWMILMTSVGIYNALKNLTAQPTRAGPSKTGMRFPEESYYMLGFFSGFLGMLIHNNTDVSMRFVSSGAPFWLLAGLNAALIMYSPLPEKQFPFLVAKSQSPAETGDGKRYLMKIFKALTLLVIGIVALKILREFDWCQMRDGMKNPNEQPHFLVTWAVFLICWGSAAWWFIQLVLHATRLKSVITILIASVLLVPFWGFFIADTDHNRAIFFSKQGIWTHTPEFDARIAGFPPEYQMMYSGGAGGTIEKESALGKMIYWLFPDMLWRRYGIGGALEHYEAVGRLRPDFIMSNYFRGNVYNDWGSQFAQKTQEAFQRGDIAQAEIFRKKTDELWNKAMGAYDDTRRLGPNYVQMHHQVGTVHQKWGDFFHNLAPLAERYGHKPLADEYRNEAREHWLKALQSYQLYYKIDPVYDQNYYRQAQVYIQLGDLDKAEETYLAHIEAKECKKPYQQIFGGFYVPEAMKDAMDYSVVPPVSLADVNRYDLASPEHTHDIVNVSKPEVWIYLGDFYSFVKNSPENPERDQKLMADYPYAYSIVKKWPNKAEACYRKAAELRTYNIEFLKRLASFYGRTGKTQEAVSVWQKIFKINPNDPDVQRVFQIKPAPPK